jgi:hypothetical protein
MRSIAAARRRVAGNSAFGRRTRSSVPVVPPGSRSGATGAPDNDIANSTQRGAHAGALQVGRASAWTRHRWSKRGWHRGDGLGCLECLRHWCRDSRDGHSGCANERNRHSDRVERAGELERAEPGATLTSRQVLRSAVLRLDPQSRLWKFRIQPALRHHVQRHVLAYRPIHLPGRRGLAVVDGDKRRELNGDGE